MRAGRVAGVVILAGLLLLGSVAGGARPAAGVGAMDVHAPGKADAVLWEQGQQGLAGVASTYHTNRSQGLYAADDFVVESAVWDLAVIFVDGWVPDGSLEGDATALTWYLYPDDGGVPAGHPGDGTELWKYVTTPDDPAVTLVNYAPQLDLVAATGAPLPLRPGAYWLVFFPSMEVTNPDESDRFNWHIGATVNAGWCAEYDDGISGGFPWTDAASLFGQPTWHDLAFRLEGTARPLSVLYLPVALSLPPGR
ncbi:MAG: hypothetical protein P8129_24540 [Anaerolineae bacterium]